MKSFKDCDMTMAVRLPLDVLPSHSTSHPVPYENGWINNIHFNMTVVGKGLTK